ncbi:MAG TPA: MASE1 domain-containing protein [Candidatus Dormibacteraeota bacterium]|nr:MASE1 domain-containing protein [Candidatus Dormibacteraeota bacterium]
MGRARPDTTAVMAAVAELSVVALLYYSVGRLGLLLQFEHTNVSPVWPPSGFAVAALLILGPRVWPALAAAAFLVNLTTGLSPPVAAAIAAGNTGEYLLAAVLLRRAGMRTGLARIADVVLLSAVGGLLAPLVAASVGTAAVSLGGYAPAGMLRTVWTTWWLGDGLGVVVFAPGLLVLHGLLRRARRSPDRGSIPPIVEPTALAAVTLTVGGLVFLSSGGFAYILFPLVVWAAVRFEQAGAAAVTLAVSSLAIWGTVHGTGPFATGTLNDRLTQLQLYSGAIGLTALVLAAAISGRRESEARVQQRTDQLEASNRELGAFTYTVSHDLRAPLRAIHGFARMLATGDGAVLSAEGSRHLETIARNARQMGRLIDSLLDHAQLGGQQLIRQPVDPAAAARAAAEQMGAGGDPARAVDIIVEEMPGCRADPVLLGQVYENLLDNAVKFSRGREPARIRVGAQHGAGAPVYYVRDNGIGFDMRYAHKLFGLFERLHTGPDFTGTGAGLAIVHRIIHRHGGRIWAEAEPGAGATFYFTIGQGEPL